MKKYPNKITKFSRIPNYSNSLIWGFTIDKIYLGYEDAETMALIYYRGILWENVKKISKPVLETYSITYDGEKKIFPTATYLNLEQFDVSGSLEAVNAGTYNISVTPKKGYCWADGTYDSIMSYWVINKLKFDKPTVSGSHTFIEGTTRSASIAGFNSTYMNKTGPESSSSTYGTSIFSKSHKKVDSS